MPRMFPTGGRFGLNAPFWWKDTRSRSRARAVIAPKTAKTKERLRCGPSFNPRSVICTCKGVCRQQSGPRLAAKARCRLRCTIAILDAEKWLTRATLCQCWVTSSRAKAKESKSRDNIWARVAFRALSPSNPKKRLHSASGSASAIASTDDMKSGIPTTSRHVFDCNSVPSQIWPVAISRCLRGG